MQAPAGGYVPEELSEYQMQLDYQDWLQEEDRFLRIMGLKESTPEPAEDY